MVCWFRSWVLLGATLSCWRFHLVPLASGDFGDELVQCCELLLMLAQGEVWSDELVHAHVGVFGQKLNLTASPKAPNNPEKPRMVAHVLCYGKYGTLAS